MKAAAETSLVSVRPEVSRPETHVVTRVWHLDMWRPVLAAVEARGTTWKTTNDQGSDFNYLSMLTPARVKPQLQCGTKTCVPSAAPGGGSERLHHGNPPRRPATGRVGLRTCSSSLLILSCLIPSY
ncbi:hypothetical protein E2C01_021188 [Portunus trituberculatus]|uniref:Uncharacterized protein n=1 Tax=Portunus trituberculatus TaxID=210409 RepID=A0A5B7E4B2_PORTR|nr:hypothetical protein [Portunus trituberculatus]